MFGELAALQGNQGRRFEVPRTYGMYVAELMTLPGLVGLWSMGDVQRSTGNVYDLSGQGRILTYNGNPTYNQYAANGVDLAIPYIDLDGVGDYLSRADETDLDILGTEAIYAAAMRGLTMGGWFWQNALGTAQTHMGKAITATNNRCYYISTLATNVVIGVVSVDGTAVTQVNSTATVTAGTWHYVSLRFTPSTELALWVNESKTTNVAAIPASIFNSATAAFMIGARDGGPPVNLLTGRCAVAWLCAQAHTDWRIESLYRWGRHLFGV